MLPPVFQALKANADVKNIVGTNPPRIYRHDDVPQGEQRPYVSWFIVGAMPENNLSDLPPCDRYMVQVDCWHADDAGIENLARACRDAIEPHAHMTSIPINERDTETRLFHIALQFDWWHGR